MKLRKPPHPNCVETGSYFYIHARHRETAIDTALNLVREAHRKEIDNSAYDVLLQELTNSMGEWVVEILLQGAWMREYHEWEKATKAYFNGHHLRNGSSTVEWRFKVAGINSPSHIDRVKAQLALFSASVPPDCLVAIDTARQQINAAKHESEHFATEADYRALIEAILAFWERLDQQEEFILPGQ